MFDLSCLSKVTNGKTRLFSAENVYARKGMGGMAEYSTVPQDDVVKIGQDYGEPNHAARELGQKWKVRPCITLKPKSRTTLVETEGPGRFTHIWITVNPQHYRDIIIRFYWDHEKIPSVECPLGDFFCCGYPKALKITSIPINVNPSGGLNCYFPMPFRKHAKVVVENLLSSDIAGFFYAISMNEDTVAEDEAYFHAKFRRENPNNYKEDYTIIDGIKGKGHYIGTQMSWQQNSQTWWGEGEFKAFIDGDTEFPSYCTTGTEDYFGGAWGFNDNFSAPFLGYQDLMSLGLYGNKRDTNCVGNRHSLYRFHIMDPIRFEKDFRAVIQSLGCGSDARYLLQQDDMASVAYWYQIEPHAKFEKLHDHCRLEVI